VLSGEQIQVATNFKIVLLLYHAPRTISALRSHKSGYPPPTDDLCYCALDVVPSAKCQELALGPTNMTNGDEYSCFANSANLLRIWYR
jgi:hypothetical protein